MLNYFMRFKRLKQDDELTEFQVNFEKNIAERSQNEHPVTLPIDYLKKSKVIGVFNKKNEMVAGWVLNFKAPFRILEAIPAEQYAKNEFLQKTPEKDLCEVTCIWRSSKILPLYFGLVVWPRVVLSCVHAKRRYIIGGDLQNKTRDLYEVASPIMIYKGPSVSIHTHSKEDVHIFAFTRTRLIANYMRNFLMLFPVRLRNQMRKTKKTADSSHAHPH